MASNHWLVPSAFNALPSLTSSAPWGRQPYEGVSLIKVSALGCPSRLPIASFPMMNIMETDGPEICRQPVSLSSTHIIAVKRQLTHGYSVYLFFFHINSVQIQLAIYSVPCKWKTTSSYFSVLMTCHFTTYNTLWSHVLYQYLLTFPKYVLNSCYYEHND